MASTRKPKRAEGAFDLLPSVRPQLAARIPAGSRIVVGLSGGVDSIVLLDLLRRLAGRRRWRLSAVHVDHGLQRQSADWARFCRRVCRAAEVSLHVAKVEVARGNSIEGAARAARYRVFLSRPADFVALAHNQDDQAETVLLHLFRGAGMRGLAGMQLVDEPPFASEAAVGATCIVRPLLGVPRADIERYARSRRLEWIEDPSNADSRYLRNFLRVEVLPLLATRIPAYRDAVLRAARHAADAAALLDELGMQDLAKCDEAGPRGLSVEALRGFPEARARNVLRVFLRMHRLEVPSRERLAEALRQSLTAAADAQVAVRLGAQHLLRRVNGALVIVKAAAAPAAGPGMGQEWSGEEALEVPGLDGLLYMRRGVGEGISASRLAAGRVTVRSRRGGEKLKLDARRPTRTVKNLMQEAAIPAWERDARPFLYCGEHLVWVDGLGVASAFRAAAGEPSVAPTWVARASG